MFYKGELQLRKNCLNCFGIQLTHIEMSSRTIAKDAYSAPFEFPTTYNTIYIMKHDLMNEQPVVQACACQNLM